MNLLRFATCNLICFFPVIGFLLLAQPVDGQTYSVLYSFCSQPNCADGGGPVAGLVFDAQGNLYGTADAEVMSGGITTYGTVFELTPSNTEIVLHSFQPRSLGDSLIIPIRRDGAFPMAGLIFDAQGDLYSTTEGGGSFGRGTVFRIAPAGEESIVHSFAPGEGAEPVASLTIDATGNLYGTTQYGGAGGCPAMLGTLPGCGTVFKITPSGREAVLYSFTGNPDGAFPMAGLIMDAQGNLYGTTFKGGAHGMGSVFKLTPSGEETVLYSFSNPPDGAFPQAGLVMDAQGNLYGTTYGGGSVKPCQNVYDGCGTVFEVAPNGQETVLHSFGNQGDGAFPFAGLVLDAEGNLYGTTYDGGEYSYGTVFELAGDGTETVMYSFCAQQPNCADGAHPWAGLVLDAQGNLYGTTSGGGSYDAGTVFKLTP